MKDDALAEAQGMIETILAHGELIVRGTEALSTLRTAIRLLVEGSGYSIDFAPNMEPTLRDYLGIVIPRVAETALAGAVVGAMIGAIAQRPKEGLLLGAGVGTAVGIAQGAQAVDEGWRVRVRHNPNWVLRLEQL